jgi:4a-hydroxytetrahydrobiopterin dehydratase
MPRITPEDAYRSLAAHPAWIVELGRIRRDYRFANFIEALAFVNRVGELAERVHHHPNIRIHEWCFVELELYSHNEGALTDRDLAFVESLEKELGHPG